MSASTGHSSARPEPIAIGLLGCGTVGTGVFQTLARGGERFAAKLGRPLAIRRILVRNPQKARDSSIPHHLFTTSAGDVLDDPGIQIVVEVMGGTEPTYDYLLSALASGKHVVTANKELLAKRGAELLLAADQSGAALRFEASVAGGIPVIKALRESLAANTVEQVMGIVNGTTNYVLTAMSETDQDFDQALETAKELGYAEADPTSDIEGHDAAYKLAILAGVTFGARVPIESIHREGISSVSASDIAYALELGYTIKLLAVADARNSKDIGLWVRPTLVPLRHPLAAVKNSFNAVFVRGDAVGELMFYGRGAGSQPTASAVIGDLLEVAELLSARTPVRNGGPSLSRDYRLTPVEKFTRQFYVRMSVADKPGVLAQIAGSFGRYEVSLSTVIQKGTGRPSVPLVFVTHRVMESDLRAALQEIALLPVVDRIDNVMPLEDDRPAEI